MVNSKNYIRFLVISFALIFANANRVICQIEIETIDPAEAVELLTGGGIEPFNISFTGFAPQMGMMTGGEGTIFPISEGLILSSGYASNIATCAEEEPSGISGDVDLVTIANSVPPLIGQSFVVSSANDICALEFDFVALGNEVIFNYVFGSDEYTEWINSQYNDMFAFFLSGPGIIGPFSSPVGFPDGSINLAIVPDTDPELPITISSINQILNSEYFVNNPDNVDICINGFTVKMNVTHEVICGETYHIKLAIADGTGEILESIVALEAGSFDSNGIYVSSIPSTTGEVEFEDETILMEGCNEAAFVIYRADASTSQEIIYEISGLASDLDYSPLSTSVTLAIGEFSAQIPISAIDDGLVEGPEDVNISYTYLNSCGDEVTTTGTFWIIDPSPPVLEPEDFTLYCGSYYLTVPVVEGYGEFDWEWYNMDGDLISTNEGIIINSLSDPQYTVVVSDPCGNEDTAIVNVILSEEDPDPIGILYEEFTLECPGDFLTIDPGVFGGAPNYFYSWEVPGGFEGPVYTSNFLEDGYIPLTIADQCGQLAEFELIINVPEYVPMEIAMSATEFNCVGQLVTLNASASLGFDPYEYIWDNGESGESTDVFPDGATTYTVQVVDNCGNVESAEIDVELTGSFPILADPVAIECPNTPLDFNYSGGFGELTLIYDTESILLEGNILVLLEPGIHFITIQDDCGQSINVEVQTAACEVIIPNIFTPGNGDDYNDSLVLTGLESYPNSSLKIFNRWGELLYSSDNYLNDWKAIGVTEGTYYYLLERSDGELQSGDLYISLEK